MDPKNILKSFLLNQKYIKLNLFYKKIIREKINLPNVTLVAIASTNVENTIKSLLYSSKDINFNEVVLISHEEPNNLPKKINFKKIKKVETYEEYNYNVVYELKNYINSQYVLLVQHDGFVINSNEWSETFLNYDYIGAPFPIPKDNISYKDDLGRLVRVGNGGFSLRSKFLLEAPTKLGLVWESFHGYFHEDGFLCCKNRSKLESYGIKFAPLEIAAKFSLETIIEENKSIKTFGTHGLKNLKKYKRYIEKLKY